MLMKSDIDVNTLNDEWTFQNLKFMLRRLFHDLNASISNCGIFLLNRIF